jgi:hypothetical protein
MKHFSLLIFVVLFIPFYTYSQNTLNQPIDIIYVEESEEYYVTNRGGVGMPGYILKLNASGEIISTFYSDLDYSGGLCRVGDTLYVLNNKDIYGGPGLPSYLLGLDINNGELIVEVEIGSGGIYLDLITTDNKGFLYFTDSENGKIYKYNIQSQTFVDFVIGIQWTIGICYNNIDDQIVFTTDNGNEGYICTTSTEGTSYTMEYQFPGRINGLIMLPNGDYYFASSTGSTGHQPVYKVAHALNWQALVNNENSYPFGLCLGNDNHLAVCNWASSSINFIDLDPFDINEIETNNAFELYPNPTEGNIKVDLSTFGANSLDLSVYDISGKKVFSKKITDLNPIDEERLDLNFLKTGSYIVTIINNNRVYHQKLIIY